MGPYHEYQRSGCLPLLQVCRSPNDKARPRRANHRRLFHCWKEGLEFPTTVLAAFIYRKSNRISIQLRVHGVEICGSGSDSSCWYVVCSILRILFSETSALEFGPHGITANAIAPGAIDTEMREQNDIHTIHLYRKLNISQSRMLCLPALHVEFSSTP